MHLYARHVAPYHFPVPHVQVNTSFSHQVTFVAYNHHRDIITHGLGDKAERDRKVDRQTDRQTHGHTYILTDRQTSKHTYIHTHIHTDRQTDRQADISYKLVLHVEQDSRC